jgi:hypothetical protein
MEPDGLRSIHTMLAQANLNTSNAPKQLYCMVYILQYIRLYYLSARFVLLTTNERTVPNHQDCLF